MISIFKSIAVFFKAEKSVYSHRNRTVEIVALEKGIDIDLLREETRAIIEREGTVEAVVTLRRRFHLPLSAAWRFVDKLVTK